MHRRPFEGRHLVYISHVGLFSLKKKIFTRPYIPPHTPPPHPLCSEWFAWGVTHRLTPFLWPPRPYRSVTSCTLRRLVTRLFIGTLKIIRQTGLSIAWPQLMNSKLRCRCHGNLMVDLLETSIVSKGFSEWVSCICLSLVTIWYLLLLHLLCCCHLRCIFGHLAAVTLGAGWP